MEQAPHPRPQLARAHWTDLCGPWAFAFDDGDHGRDEHWEERTDVFERTITVPFPPESPASGIGETGFHPVVWYRRSFHCPWNPSTRVLLHCGAIDYRACVWINGRVVAEHEGGHIAFQADITAALRPDGEQTIVVRVEDLPDDLAQPRGKQDWQEEPHEIFYHRTTGIWRPIWLEDVGPIWIDALRWTPRIDPPALGLAVRLAGAAIDGLQLRVRLRLGEVALADQRLPVGGRELDHLFSLHPLGAMDPESYLWAPEHPHLIEAQLTLLQNGKMVDEVQSYAGLRRVDVANGAFRLNGRPYYLRLALDQGYWPESHLAAPSDAALRREVELARELGFNGVRWHQTVADPRFLAWCDRLGLLVWGEMANAFVFSPAAARRLLREWIEAVAEHVSHPCIVCWVPLNESWGVPDLLNDETQAHFVRAIYHLTKALDPTRPVIANDGWEYLCGEIIGIHDYASAGEELRRRYRSREAIERSLREEQPGRRALTLPGLVDEGQAIVLSEVGGTSFDVSHDRPWVPYAAVETAAAFVERYQELIGAILDSEGLAGFCYTQLTDTAQETNGLLTEQRVPKVDPALIRAITCRGESFST